MLSQLVLPQKTNKFELFTMFALLIFLIYFNYSDAICKPPGLGSLLVQGASAPQL